MNKIKDNRKMTPEIEEMLLSEAKEKYYNKKYGCDK